MRIYQYAAGGSLWLDELALSRNIVNRSLGPLLTEPLAYNQVAPRGFLLLERFAVLTLGAGEWQLRLVPLASSLAALALFPLMAARLLDGAAILIAVALFALNLPQAWYAAEVKPYSADVAVAVGLVVLALRWQRGRRPGQAVVLAAAGAGAVWFSTPAVLVLAGLGAALGLAAMAEKDRNAARQLGAIAGVWLIAAAIALAAAFHTLPPATAAVFQGFWSQGFPPSGASFVGVALWLPRAVRDAFRLTLGYPWPTVYAAVASLGVVALARRPRAALLVIGPIAATAGAALVRQYPFLDRLILFLAPALICLVAAAIEWARSRVHRAPVLGGVVVAAAMLPLLATVRQFRSPRHVEEVRPVLAHVRAAWRPGDVLYVYYGGWHAAAFYGPRFGFSRGDIRFGGCHRDNVQRYIDELDRLRGRSRVWLLFVHALRSERTPMLDHLARIGVQRDSVISRRGSSQFAPPSAYLYNLAALPETGVAGPSSEPPDSARDLGDPICERGPQDPPPRTDPYW